MKRALIAVFVAACLSACRTADFHRQLGIGQVLSETKRPGFADDVARALAAATPGSEIRFADFSDLPYVAITDSVATKDGVTIWQGRIGEAGFWGRATAVVNGSDVVGSVQVDNHIFAIRTQDGGLLVSEVDHTLFPEEGEPRAIAKQAVENAQLNVQEMSRPKSLRPPETAVTLRVLLVVPPSLSKWCTPVSSRLMAKMSEANVNGVWAHFTGGAVTSEMSVYCTEHESSGDLYTDLDWVMNDAGVKAQRASTSSNMVAFMVPEAKNCGQSYANYPVDDPEANTRAFSVVRIDCAWENYSLAHELGHQLGMDHDRYTISGGYLDRCNYGYSFIKDGKPVARDVMAYTGYCKSLGVDCPRIGTYSVAETLGGVQMGVPCSVTGTTDPVAGAANNVEQLRLAAPIAATWH